MKKIVVIILSVLAVMNAVFIFYNSSQTNEKSLKISKDISEYIVEKTDSDYAEKDQREQWRTLNKTNAQIRSYAHTLEFLSLAFLLALIALIAPTKRMNMTVWTLSVFPACVAYAFLDEWHQTFVDGRNFQWQDIVHDIQGSAVGIIVAVALYGLFFALKNYIMKKKRGVA